MIRKKKRKIKYKNKLWKIFSQVIRRRDADENGNVKCISCPTVKHWTEMQAGHYRPKSLGLVLYFLEKNVKPQCATCNLTLQGNQYAFGNALIDLYGDEVLEEIEAVRKNIRQIKAWEYEELIEKYEAELNALVSKQDGEIFGKRG